MDIFVESKKLLNALHCAQRAIYKNSTIPILSHALLEAEGGRLSIRCTDTSMDMVLQIEAKVKKEGRATASVRKLHDLLRLLPDEKVRLKQQENFWLQLICEEKKYKLPGFAPEHFPESPTPAEPLAKIPASVLYSMISKTEFAISKEEHRYALNGALLILRPNSIAAVATDGQRLALVEIQHDFTDSDLHDELRVLIPERSFREMGRLAKQICMGDESSNSDITFSHDEKYIFLHFPNTMLISRKLEGQFPGYERALPQSSTSEFVLQSEEFRAALLRVVQLSDPVNFAVRLNLNKETVVVCTSNPEGEASEVLPLIRAEGNLPIAIAFNARFLLDFLSLVDGEIKILLTSENSAAEFRPADSSCNYRYIVMPLRS